MKNINIGLFGFGCVGQGLYYVLENSTGFKTRIKRITVKNQLKQRNIPEHYFSYCKSEILNDPDINVVVELIDDADEAFNIVKEALLKGKHVVTANKKMVALHLEELDSIVTQNKVSLLYEASACGSIPIIRSLEEYFDNEEIVKISGIFNGTTNYILTKTIEEGKSYQEALSEAQQNGFAESDPTTDVEGFDALYKTVIIAYHSFGIILYPKEMLNLGITTLAPQDIRFAKEKGFKIKLIPFVKKVENKQIIAFVLPSFVSKDNHLYKVNQEYNGVIVEGLFSGEQFFQGKGAGSHPTGAAVLSDISALSYDYKYENKKKQQGNFLKFTNEYLIRVYVRVSSSVQLDELHLLNIEERYQNTEYQYIIGTVLIESLRKKRDYILKNNIFVAHLDN